MENRKFKVWQVRDCAFVPTESVFINNSKVFIKIHSEIMEVKNYIIYWCTGLKDTHKEDILIGRDVVEFQLKKKIRGAKKRDLKFQGVFKYNEIEKLLEIHFDYKFWHYQSNIIRYSDIRKEIKKMEIVSS